jgi:hypothetical protein
MSSRAVEKSVKLTVNQKGRSQSLGQLSATAAGVFELFGFVKNDASKNHRSKKCLQDYFPKPV